MRPNRRSTTTPAKSARIRGAAAAMAAVAALLAIGCGSDDGESGGDLQRLTISADRSGKLDAPASAEAGTTEIAVDNAAERPAEVQLVRVEGDRSAAEVVQALGAVEQGNAMPEWFLPAGGVAPTAPGASASVTQALPPGTYYAFDAAAGPPDPQSVPRIEVTGEAPDPSLPATEARVTAFDYGFETEGLEAGENEVLFENTGEQPHHLIAIPIAAGRTIEDVERFMRTEEGQPPLDDDREVSTTVIEGGESQRITLDLDPGKYALLCFIADRQGGPPHIAKGMIDEVDITG